MFNAKMRAVREFFKAEKNVVRITPKTNDNIYDDKETLNQIKIINKDNKNYKFKRTKGNKEFEEHLNNKILFKDLNKLTKKINDNFDSIDLVMKRLNEIEFKKLKREHQIQFKNLWYQYYDLLAFIQNTCNQTLLICEKTNMKGDLIEFKQPFFDLQRPMIGMINEIRKFMRDIDFYEHEYIDINDIRFGFKNIIISFSSIFFAISFLSYFHENYSKFSTPQSLTEVFSIVFGVYKTSEKDVEKYNQQVDQINNDLESFIPKIKEIVKEWQNNINEIQVLNNNITHFELDNNRTFFNAEFKESIRSLRDKVMMCKN